MLKVVVATGFAVSLASRPQLTRASASDLVAKVGNLMTGILDPKKRLVALKDAGAILSEADPDATEHLTDSDKETLEKIEGIMERIYESLEDEWITDTDDLNNKLKEIKKLNTEMMESQADPDTLDPPVDGSGYLFGFKSKAMTENALLESKAKEQLLAEQTWKEKDESLTRLMNNMAGPPGPCEPVPVHRTAMELDAYFDDNKYVTWYTDQAKIYNPESDEWDTAYTALNTANQAYDLKLCERDTEYFAYETVLKEECGKFDTNYDTLVGEYNDLTIRVDNSAADRQAIYEAGQTLIQEVNKLLGVDTVTEIEPDHYAVVFESVEAKGECDMNILDETHTDYTDVWVKEYDEPSNRHLPKPDEGSCDGPGKGNP